MSKKREVIECGRPFYIRPKGQTLYPLNDTELYKIAIKAGAVRNVSKRMTLYNVQLIDKYLESKDMEADDSENDVKVEADDGENDVKVVNDDSENDVKVVKVVKVDAEPQCYVYRYLKKGTTIYVGITNNMRARVYQHTQDKLAGQYDTIEYFPTKTRGDAEILEAYLINHFGTGKYFNVSKTKIGEVSFLGDITNLPWVKWDGVVDYSLHCFEIRDLLPDIITKVEIIEKRVVPKGAKEEQIIDNFNTRLSEAQKKLRKEKEGAKKAITRLKNMLKAKDTFSDKLTEDCILDALSLNEERLGIVNDIERTLPFGNLKPHIEEYIINKDKRNNLRERILAKTELRSAG